MALARSIGLRLRRTQLPSYICASLTTLAFVAWLGGIAWLLLLPLEGFHRHTYVSENALLPGQVHTYFSGSEENVLLAFCEEVRGLANTSRHDRHAALSAILHNIGLQTERQTYLQPDGTVAQNVQGILRAPRGDATESMVLLAAWTNMEGAFNDNGVALLIALARYLQRWTVWSKDIVFLIAEDSIVGPQAWADAYHDTHDPARVAPLALKSGEIQGAVAVDFAGPHTRFDRLQLVYDGINGCQPNLDLFNTAFLVAAGQMGIHTSIHRMWAHHNTYTDRLITALYGMGRQAAGYATGPHSIFIPYRIDAITLKVFGSEEGRHSTMALGQTIESVCRSINNLLEHFHQSFFFYLLLHMQLFVSIGTYLPGALLLAGSFTVNALGLIFTTPPTREFLCPMITIVIAHASGMLPFLLFNYTSASGPATFALLSIAGGCAPFLYAWMLPQRYINESALRLIKSYTLLLLGMSLSALATINFALAFGLGMVAFPLHVARSTPSPRSISLWLQIILHYTVSPSLVLLAVASLTGRSLHAALAEAILAWRVSRVWTQLIVWLVWWPAWCSAAVLLAACRLPTREISNGKKTN